MPYVYDSEGNRVWESTPTSHHTAVTTHQNDGLYTRIIADPITGQPREVTYRPQFDNDLPRRFRPDDGRGYSTGKKNSQTAKSQVETDSSLDDWSPASIYESPLYH